MRSVLSAAILSLGLLAASFQPALSAEADPVKAAAIEELLEVTHSVDTGMSAANQLMTMMVNATKAANPGQEALATDLVHGAIMVAFNDHRDEFKLIMVKVYDDNFTTEEIQEILAFQKSPIGQKIIERRPVVLKQSLEMGAELGGRVSRIAIINLVRALQDAQLKVPAGLQM